MINIQLRTNDAKASSAIDKLHKVFCSYSLKVSNDFIIGKGGNRDNLLKLLEIPISMEDDVNNKDIASFSISLYDNKLNLIFNLMPVLKSSTLDIRNFLDKILEKISVNTKPENLVKALNIASDIKIASSVNESIDRLINALLELPEELQLLAIRERIGIEFIIKNSLDMHPLMSNVFNKINKALA